MKFLDLSRLTTLAEVREIECEAKIDIHVRHVVFMNYYFADFVNRV